MVFINIEQDRFPDDIEQCSYQFRLLPITSQSLPHPHCRSYASLIKLVNPGAILMILGDILASRRDMESIALVVLLPEVPPTAIVFRLSVIKVPAIRCVLKWEWISFCPLHFRNGIFNGGGNNHQIGWCTDPFPVLLKATNA